MPRFQGDPELAECTAYDHMRIASPNFISHEEASGMHRSNLANRGIVLPCRRYRVHWMHETIRSTIRIRKSSPENRFAGRM